MATKASNFFTDDMYDNYQNTTLRRRRTREDQSKDRRRRPNQKPWYSDGYPALRYADKKAREKRNQQNKSRTGSKRSRSLPNDPSYYGRQRTRSIYKDTTETLRSASNRLRSNSVGSVTSYRSRRDSFTPSHVIYKTYTGIDSHEEIKSRVGSSFSVRSRIGSSKSTSGGIVQKKVETVKPYLRSNYVLNDIQSRSYKKMHQTYDVIGSDSKWLTETMKRLKLEGNRVKNTYSHMDNVYRFLVDDSLKQFKQLNKLTRKYEAASKTKYHVQNADAPRLLEAKFRRLSERGLADTMAVSNRSRNPRNTRLKPLEHRPRINPDPVNIYLPSETDPSRSNKNRSYRSRSDHTNKRSKAIRTDNMQTPTNTMVRGGRRSHPLKLKPQGHNLAKHRVSDERPLGMRLAT